MFTFIDLFAGIGGIRIAFEANGGNCVFSSEYNGYSQLTYESFFGEKPDFSKVMKTYPPGDITKLEPALIPDHDILTGGFPCQPFSLAGVSKKSSMGRPTGFDDPTQGTLFFNIKSILERKAPKAFLLENVKNLINHDHGRTFSIILDSLNDVNYNVFYKVIDASSWLPQHRERIYIVGFRKKGYDDQSWSIDSFPEFEYMEKPPKRLFELEDIFEENIDEKYTLTLGTWNALLKHKERHLQKGQGFGFGLISRPYEGKITRTLSARYYKDGGEILIDQPNKRPRRLTPLECSRLMGFPLHYQSYFDHNSGLRQPVSDIQAYRQFGNSVAVPVVEEIASLMIQKLTRVGALE